MGVTWSRWTAGTRGGVKTRGMRTAGTHGAGARAPRGAGTHGVGRLVAMVLALVVVACLLLAGGARAGAYRVGQGGGGGGAHGGGAVRLGSRGRPRSDARAAHRDGLLARPLQVPGAGRPRPGGA